MRTLGGSDLRRLAVGGPLLLALFQLVGTIGASHNQVGHRGLDALAVILVVAGPLSLLAVGSRPREVLWFVVALTVTYLLRDYPYGPVFASLALAVVLAVVAGHRANAWAGLATVLVANFGLKPLVVDQSWSWAWMSGALAWSLLLLALGEVIRVRRERMSTARRARAAAARSQASEERLLIARELHDVVAHHISLINVQAGVALHIVDRRPEQARTALVAIKDASKEALVELRSLVGVLRDVDEGAPRGPGGSLAALDDLVERSRHAGLAVRTSNEGTPRPLPTAVELAAVRIVQESITNVVRHSGARSAHIALTYGTDALSVTITDDGRGLSSGRTDGSGLVGMRERAEALGGSLQVDTAPTGGTRVCALLPLPLGTTP